MGYWIYPGERRPVVVMADTQEEADKEVRQSPDYDGFGGRIYTVEEYSTLCKRTIHSLKSWPEYYRPVVDGKKKFEVRVGNDRTYQAGDYIDLVEIDKETRKPTGSHATREITYVMHGAPFLPPDVWVLALKIPDELTVQKP